jgi:predicted nucleic acid-binding protein
LTDKGALGKDARELVKLVEEGATQGFISPLVIDEVVWKLRKELKSHKASIDVSKRIVRMSNLTVLSITLDETNKAFDFMEKYELKPRDALHVATMLQNNVKIIVSEDPDFKKVREIEALRFSEALRRLK